MRQRYFDQEKFEAAMDKLYEYYLEEETGIVESFEEFMDRFLEEAEDNYSDIEEMA